MQPDPGRRASPADRAVTGAGRSPVATYRVQLNRDFTFDDAAAIGGYLADLGVSHLYSSPILRATPGSTHGYDVVDPTRVNPELGGESGHERLCAALGAAGIGQLLDVVPNHMAIGGRENQWWWDVLRNGPSSRWAGYFDVDWDSQEVGMRNTVLLPILGDHYGRELEAGRLALAVEDGEIVVRYFDHAAPIDPAALDGLLRDAAGTLEGDDAQQLRAVAEDCGALPPASTSRLQLVAERQRRVDPLLARLAALLDERAPARAAVDAALAACTADVDALDGLLARQSYRLAWWRSAGENLDYRRFFDINDLAGIRVEEPQVFADSHWLVLDWLANGVIDGVRIDHVDGLLDPARYLGRLAAAAPGAWILVEKILESGEQLPAGWPVAGTTGYDWLNRVGDVLTSRAGWERMRASYETFTGLTELYEDLVYRAKMAVLDGPLAADLNRLTGRVADVCAGHRRHRDHTRRDLRDALAEVAASFPVYRTYVAPGGEGTLIASERDVEVVEQAVRAAAIRRADIDDDLLAFLRDLLLGRVPGDDETDVALRFQQLTGPVMAKAVEDRVFYRYLPLTSRNEVGGNPGSLDDDLGTFHDEVARAQREHPLALLATSTHDTKRSEDVRARLSVLAEIPDEWTATVDAWWEEACRAAMPPDRNTAWLILQTLVGAWPIDADRAVAYVEKATREAKDHTSWTDPDAVYDEVVAAFVRIVLERPATVTLVEGLVERVRAPGQAVSLAQKLLTVTAPGVADLYQGSELWDLSLVDPDNRRPVDYDLRQRLVAGGPDARRAWATGDPEGESKLAVVRAALALRGERPASFGPGEAGSYGPLPGAGPAAAHLVGFVRGGDVAALVTRWPLLLEQAGGWRDTTVSLPAGRWIDRLGGGTWEGTVLVADVLDGLPVALLAGPPSRAGR